MRFRILSLPLSLMFLIGTISMGSLNAAYSTTATSCTASLDGSQEVPLVDTDGTGSATIQFDPSVNVLFWSIEFSDLSGPATAAHFHGPAAEGANAGVQVNIGEVSGLDSPMEGSAELTSEQASMLVDGMLYINVHTEANSGGEIRGQVSCEPPAQDEETETANLVIGDQEFDIGYTISGGTLDELTADPALQTLLVTISTTSDGNLTIWLPTEAIDAEDDEFSVFIDDEFGNFLVDEQDPTADARVLRIEFPNGAEEIEIVGTSMAGEEPEPETQTISVEIGGQAYDIEYEITGGSVQNLTADVESKSLTFAISSNSSGILTVWLPTEVIDAEDEFSALVDGQSADLTEQDPTADARVLRIEFPNGAEEIEITGTSIVPEFGTLTMIVVSVAIIGAIVATTRFHKFGGLRR